MTNTLKTLRESAAMTQEDLAASSGVATRTIQRIEAGQEGRMETLRTLAAALRVDVDLLLPPKLLRDRVMLELERRIDSRGVYAGHVSDFLEATDAEYEFDVHQALVQLKQAGRLALYIEGTGHFEARLSTY